MKYFSIDTFVSQSNHNIKFNVLFVNINIKKSLLL